MDKEINFKSLPDAKMLAIHECNNTSSIVPNIKTIEVKETPMEKASNSNNYKTMKIGSRGNRYNENEKLEFATAIEEQLKNGTFKKSDFCSKYNISYPTMKKIADDFNLNLPDERCKKATEEEGINTMKKSSTNKKTINYKKENEKFSKKDLKNIIEEQLADEKELTNEENTQIRFGSIETDELVYSGSNYEITKLINGDTAKSLEAELTVNEIVAFDKEIINESEYLSDINDEASEAANKILSDIEEFDSLKASKEKRGNIELIHPVRSSINPICKVGLISNRHSLPTSKYIYHILSNDDIMNFDQLYVDALNFIDKNIPFIDGVATRSIDLYVTGAVMVNAAVIKACITRKINLNLFHYCPPSKSYKCQPILSNFNQITNGGANTLFDYFTNDPKERNFTIFGFDNLNQIKKKDTFYIVKKSRFNNSWSNRAKNWDTCLCKNINDAFTVYTQFVTEIIKSKEKSSAVYCSVQINSAKYNPEGTIIVEDCISNGNFGLNR